MTLAIHTETDWHSLVVCNEFPHERCQKDRILAALGPLGNKTTPASTMRNDSSLLPVSRAHLSFPFTAHYPSGESRRKSTYRCTVVELLDPRKTQIWDEFQRHFLQGPEGRLEGELSADRIESAEEHSPNFQLIEDYWYWFWNWRRGERSLFPQFQLGTRHPTVGQLGDGFRDEDARPGRLLGLGVEFRSANRTSLCLPFHVRRLLVPVPDAVAHASGPSGPESSVLGAPS